MRQKCVQTSTACLHTSTHVSVHISSRSGGGVPMAEDVRRFVVGHRLILPAVPDSACNIHAATCMHCTRDINATCMLYMLHTCYVLRTCCTHAPYMLRTRSVHASYMLRTCPIHAPYMPRTCSVHAPCMPCACSVHATCMLCPCKTHVSFT